MGYRSDIAFAITVDNYKTDDVRCLNKFKYMVGAFKLSDFYHMAKQHDYDLVKNKNLGWSWREGGIYFNADSWKWYDSFPLVQAYNAMWKAMQSIEGVSGRFIRSGEDTEDNEYDEFGEEPDYDLAYINKAMTFERYNVLGETESEEESDEQVQADTHSCGQDADQDH